MSATQLILSKLASIEKQLAATKEVLTFEEAALYMGVKLRQVWKLTAGTKNGAPRLKSFKPAGQGGRGYIRKQDMLDYLLQNSRMSESEVNREADKILLKAI